MCHRYAIDSLLLVIRAPTCVKEQTSTASNPLRHLQRCKALQWGERHHRKSTVQPQCRVSSGQPRFPLLFFFFLSVCNTRQRLSVHMYHAPGRARAAVAGTRCMQLQVLGSLRSHPDTPHRPTAPPYTKRHVSLLYHYVRASMVVNAYTARCMCSRMLAAPAGSKA